jgi:outer membrane protein OmpA-like peptidoglycan-associated protein
MIKLPIGAVLLLALAGCATGTGVSLFPGEKTPKGEQNETGAVVVLDPSTEQDVAVLDRANSRTGVNRRRVSVKNLTPERLETQYGALLGSLPRQPVVINLYFKEGSTDLVDESVVPALFDEIKSRPGVDIQIVGHTDTTGSDELNDRLSAERAEQIKIKLTGLGLDSNITRTSGRGERELAEQTADNVANDKNRRVQVIVR